MVLLVGVDSKVAKAQFIGASYEIRDEQAAQMVPTKLGTDSNPVQGCIVFWCSIAAPRTIDWLVVRVGCL